MNPDSFDPRAFRILDPNTACVICALTAGRLMKFGPVAVHANGRGYRITIAGKIVARGATPKELNASFKAAVNKACQEKE